MDRLKVLFEEIGGYQQAIERGMPFSAAKDEIYNRCLEANILMPPGNDHIWEEFRLWLMQGWAAAYKRDGDAEAEPWRELLQEFGELTW